MPKTDFERSKIRLVQKIADLIGVSASSLYTTSYETVFHRNISGDEWLLRRNHTNEISIEHRLSKDAIRNGDTESMLIFLSKNSDTAQGKALAEYLSNLVSNHFDSAEFEKIERR